MKNLAIDHGDVNKILNCFDDDDMKLIILKTVRSNLTDPDNRLKIVDNIKNDETKLKALNTLLEYRVCKYHSGSQQTSSVSELQKRQRANGQQFQKIPYNEYVRLEYSVRTAPSDNQRLFFIKGTCGGYAFTCDQVAILADSMVTYTSKVYALYLFQERLVDPENIDHIEKAFSEYELPINIGFITQNMQKCNYENSESEGVQFKYQNGHEFQAQMRELAKIGDDVNKFAFVQNLVNGFVYDCGEVVEICKKFNNSTIKAQVVILLRNNIVDPKN
mmetsp:Transcript_31368/g.28554  ORF Transcript_31368/g.28554 Transcript_31368/m.28554 type:complete len:275 (-) Transcript_31368:180-1004(-)